MRILLLQDQDEFRDKLVFLLESTYGAQVEIATTVAGATDILLNTGKKHLPPLDLIILDLKHSKINDSDRFWTLVANIHTLVCVEDGQKVSTGAAKKIASVNRAALLSEIAKALDVLVAKGSGAVRTPTAKSASAAASTPAPAPASSSPSTPSSDSQSDAGQVRIKSSLLLSVAPLKGDIYIRLGQDKYVKLFNEGDTFDLTDLEKYTVRKGIEYLYIRKEQCAEFATKYQLELEKLLKQEKINSKAAGQLGNVVQEIVHELNTQIGFTKEVQEITRTYVKLAVKSMGQEPSLVDILKKIKESEGKYISSHSIICAYISCAIAAQLKWSSEMTFYKLALASFMHDITLDNHELAAFQSLESVQQSGRFTPQEIRQFKDHPIAASEMVKSMSEVPPDVDTIVVQHHERPDGSGFPRHLTHSYIAPLTAVFIVAHDLTDYILTAGDSFNMTEYLNKNRGQHTSSQFRKVFACIEFLQQVKDLSAIIKKQLPPTTSSA